MNFLVFSLSLPLTVRFVAARNSGNATSKNNCHKQKWFSIFIQQLNGNFVRKYIYFCVKPLSVAYFCRNLCMETNASLNCWIVVRACAREKHSPFANISEVRLVHVNILSDELYAQKQSPKIIVNRMEIEQRREQHKRSNRIFECRNRNILFGRFIWGPEQQ